MRILQLQDGNFYYVWMPTVIAHSVALAWKYQVLALVVRPLNTNELKALAKQHKRLDKL